MYPKELVTPMKEDLTTVGFKDLVTADDVDKMLGQEEESVLLVVNSVCGCAAGNARPAVKSAVDNDKIPDNLVTVFAGVDSEAVDQARKYLLPYPPSSPSIGLFQNGKLVHFIERHNIEGKPAESIAENLKAAFDEYC